MSTMLRRDDYKAVKRMDRTAMSAYLVRIYERGYKAALNQMRPKQEPEAAELNVAQTAEPEPNE